MEQKEKKVKEHMRITILLIVLLLLCIYVLSHRIEKINAIRTVININSSNAIKVTEKNTEWKFLEDLDIFSNPTYNNKRIVAPGSKNTYRFSVQNTVGKDVVSNIIFKEENKYNINMQYKLKINNEYIYSSEWQRPEKVNVYGFLIERNEELDIELEWHWVESENDTAIGTTNGADYKLTVDIEAEYEDE